MSRNDHNQFTFGLLLLSVVVLFALLTSGCGGPMIFAKPGAGPSELEADKYDCQVQWDQSAQGMAFARDPLNYAYYGFQYKGKMVACLAHKGWVLTNG